MIRTSACALVAALLAAPLAAQTGTVRTYVSSDQRLVNPERGFYRTTAPFYVGTSRTPLDSRTLRTWRDQGVSVVRAYYVFDEFIGSDLPPSALRAMEADFTEARLAGVKLIPRITYSFPCVGALEPCTTAAMTVVPTDPPVERVLAHIDALAPVLRGASDVIAFIEAGFIGAWGEWHHSTSGLLNPDQTANASSRAIIDRLLWAVPDSRMVALRTPLLKQGFTGVDPLSPSEAFNGSAQARLGGHNDCVLHGADDGWLQTSTTQKLASLRKFLFFDNRFVPQGGETCASPDNEPNQPIAHAHCPTALRELEIGRFDVLNLEYHPDVIELWRREGCFDEVQRRLGYRFRLVDSDLPASLDAGQRLAGRVRLVNDGWSAPYNPRLVELVVRSRATGRLTRVPLQDDPRLWMPGDTQTLNLAVDLPPLEAGTYDLLLNLPDPDPRLYGDPAYSIQLANEGVWEPGTGFNRLLASLTVGR